jgi:ABC-2 type transport system permease protein
MNALLTTLLGGFQAEVTHLSRSRLFVALTVIQAVTFLFLVSLFGLTGSRAPTAVISEDQGPYASAFITQLTSAHHSFDLRQMDQAAAQAALRKGDLVAIITIPKDFSNTIAHGQNTTVNVAVDNVNTDMTDDIQRALPSAIVALGNQLQLSNLHVHVAERDLLAHDTGFIPYLVVSGLALDAFVIASILSAMAVAREFEAGTIKHLAVAPVHPLISILGRVLATDIVASIAMVFPVMLAIFAYQIEPAHPIEMIGVILLCVAIFSCIGVSLGAVLKRTLPVASFVFGLCLPLYIGSNSMEPQRFDGNLIWVLAHVSPVYYAVAILENAFHDLQVTPESMLTNLLVLIGWAVLMLLLSGVFLRTAVLQRTATPRVTKEQAGDQKGQRIALSETWLWRKRRFVLNVNILWLLLAILLLISCSNWLNSQWSFRATALNGQQRVAVQASIDQQRETLFLNYTGRISDMLVHNDLLHANSTNGYGRIATTLTLETLRQLDPERKALLIRFLYDAKLLDDEYHAIDLRGADLQTGQFAGFYMTDTNLAGVDFSSADLHGINLHIAVLASTDFSGANLANADLGGADLSNADLSNADLTGANLSGANLRNANLSNADLTNANLQGAVGVTAPQLEKASSLNGTTLPDGSAPTKYNGDTDDG